MCVVECCIFQVERFPKIKKEQNGFIIENFMIY